MKVGILTFHWAQNYGAILQAHALGTYLHDAGVSVEIVDFSTNRQRKVSRMFPRLGKGSIVPGLGRWLLTVPRVGELARRGRLFEEFRRQRLPLGRRYESVEALSVDPPKLDVAITGSDQVFNPMILPQEELGVYALKGFSSKATKKVAYGASFGAGELAEADRAFLREPLRDFASLSAREGSGARLMREMTGREAAVVVDPVLLVDRIHWRSLEVPLGGVPSRYLLFYALNPTGLAVRQVAQVGQMTGLPVVTVRSRVQRVRGAGRTVYGAGPGEFLWLLRNASFVVTDSFHGLVLSTLMEVPFLAFASAAKTTERLRSFVAGVGLENRLIDPGGLPTGDLPEMSFVEPRDRLAQLIDQSEGYVRRALGIGSRQC